MSFSKTFRDSIAPEIDHVMKNPAHMREGELIQYAQRHSRAFWIVAVGTVYYFSGKFGLSLAYVNASASAVWPPTGIAFTAFLLLGNWIWPAILSGAFLVNITTTGSIPASIGIAIGNTLEGLVAAYLVQRFASGKDVFERPQDILKFVLFGAIVGPVISATIGVLCVSVGGFAFWYEGWTIWVTWWLGDAAGNVIVAPLLILWILHPRVRMTVDQVFEILFLLGFLVAVSQLAFGVWDLMEKKYPLSFLCIPPLVWTAFRFGSRETATANAVFSIMAIKGTIEGIGSFALGTPNESLLLLQAFIGINAVMVLALAAVVAERRRTAEQLEQARNELEDRVGERTAELVFTNKELQSEMSERIMAVEASKRAEEKFRSLLESAPDAMIMVDAEGTIQLMNSQSEQMFGYKREELIGSSVEALLPAGIKAKHVHHRATYFQEPRVRPMGMGLELFAIRKDGSQFPVEISLSPLMTSEGVLVTAAIRDITERKHLQLRLDQVQQQRTEDLQAFAASVQQAQEEERHRIARELHDDLGQKLSGLKLNIQVAEGGVLANNRKAKARLKTMKEQIDDMIAEIRRISANLRPTALDDFGLLISLQLLCREFEKASDLKIVFQAERSMPERFHPQVEIALYRVLQEALTNISKHANATTVMVSVGQKNGSVVLEIKDDGKGFEKESEDMRRRAGRGMGFMSMKERSEHLGGIWSVESSVGKGTSIHVEIPLSV